MSLSCNYKGDGKANKEKKKANVPDREWGLGRATVSSSGHVSILTCAFHFRQRPPVPLKVGMPLSALTPAPVMMAICLALENTSRNLAMSARHKQSSDL